MSGFLALDGDGRFVSSDTAGVLFFECCFSLRPRWWLMLQGVFLVDFGYIPHTVEQGDL